MTRRVIRHCSEKGSLSSCHSRTQTFWRGTRFRPTACLLGVVVRRPTSSSLGAFQGQAAWGHPHWNRRGAHEVEAELPPKTVTDFSSEKRDSIAGDSIASCAMLRESVRLRNRALPVELFNQRSQQLTTGARTQVRGRRQPLLKAKRNYWQPHQNLANGASWPGEWRSTCFRGIKSTTRRS